MAKPIPSWMQELLDEPTLREQVSELPVDAPLSEVFNLIFKWQGKEARRNRIREQLAPDIRVKVA